MSDTFRVLDLLDDERSDGSSVNVYLSHWLGSDEQPAKSPEIILSALGTEIGEIGVTLKLTPIQAREMAVALIKAAQKIDDGWK